MRNVHPSAGKSGCDDLSLTHELVTTRQNLEGMAESGADEQMLGELAATIEGAIIPRLLLNHGIAADVSVEAKDFAAGIDARTLDDFMRAVMGGDAAAPGELVRHLRSRGVSKEVILLDLFGPAARVMGELWSADLCTFVDVTLGLSRLQALMRNLGGLREGDAGTESSKGRALLAPAPGEQHTLGLRVVEEFLLREGWDVNSRVQGDVPGIAGAISTEWYEFAGLSASAETLIVGLAEAISAIRKESLNPDIKILVGGALFAIRPGLGTVLGADACCADPREAVRLASLWARNGSAAKLNLS